MDTHHIEHALDSLEQASRALKGKAVTSADWQNADALRIDAKLAREELARLHAKDD